MINSALTYVNNFVPSIDNILNDIDINNNINYNILDDSLLNEMKNFGLNFPVPQIDLTSFFDINNCENWNMKNLVTTVQDPVNATLLLYKEQLMKMRLMAIEEYNNLKKIDIEKILKEIIDEFKNQIMNIYEQLKLKYNAVIEFFKSMYRSMVVLYKKIKNTSRSKEEKKKIKNKILNELKRIGGDIYEMFGIFIIIDFIKDAWKCIKNVFGPGKLTWKSVLDSIKEIGELLGIPEIANSSRIGSVVQIILSLIPILGTVATIVLSIIECNKAQKKCDENLLNKELINYDVNEYNNYSDLSELLSKVKTDSSLIESDDSSVISICPVYDNSDAFISPKNNGYILEIGTDITDYNFNINIDQKISLNDEIGNIMNIPIKSKIEGIVKEKTNRHILIEKINLNDSDLIDKINNISISVENMNIETDEDSKKILELSEKLKKMNEIEILIKDYLNEIYKPLLYGEAIINKRLLLNSDTVNGHVKEQYNKHELLRDELNEFIKKYGDAEIIKPYAEKNNLKEIADKIINKKYYIIDSILDNIEKYKNKKLYISTSDDCKFCDYYLKFMMLECDNNEYFDKLYNIINDFYIKRFKYEEHNIQDLKNKFNNVLKRDKIKNISFDTIKKSLKGNNTFEDIKKYLEKKYPSTIENRNGIIKALSNLYILINDVNGIKRTSSNETSLKKITKEESIKLYNFILEIKTEYNDYKKLLSNIDKLFNYVNWPNPSEIYIDNVQYSHYLFTNEKNNVNNTNLYDDVLSGISEAQPNKFLYWQKYCAMATLMNCTLPAYWSTGLVLMGVPIPMPIILLPITYIEGRISAVIGLGICGIAISPMMIIINCSDLVGSVLLPINLIIEMAMQILIDFKNIQFKTINITTKPMIEALNNKIKSSQDEIKQLKQQIALFKNL